MGEAVIMIQQASANLKLQELLIVWEEAREHGETMSAELLCRDCPELAGELGQRIQALRDWDRLTPDSSARSSSSSEGVAQTLTCAPASACVTVNLSDLRVHDRGGLGIIYKARHQDLPRDVALKFIRHDRSDDPQSSRRFLREAQITARLEHPGIVPIYGMGRDEIGNPCYAMRFVEGTTLEQAIKEYHAYGDHDRDRFSPGTDRAFRVLLQRFKSACTTVGYAHSRGVLHRDIKPANIMLGPFDETLVVDWGLGKIIASDDAEAGDEPEQETLLPSLVSKELGTCGVIGTPGFMSPEQHTGQWANVGPASDIYGLGATLYVLLTGRSPFDGRSPGEIAAKVERGDFAPPWQVKPAIPRPLEAICLKAMALAPEDRYSSAVDLAGDLEDWMADEPVSVLPYSWTQRLGRWQRRHRSVTMAAMLILVSITIAAVVATVVVSRARDAEHRALAKAESRADLAIQAVQKFREAIRDNPNLRDRPDLSALRKTLLGEPLKFFQQLRDELERSRDTSPAITLKLGKANRDLGTLLSEIASKPDAILAYEQAVATLVPLADSHPASGDRDKQQARAIIAESLGQLGLLQRDVGKADEARQSLKKALDYCNRLTPDESDPRIPLLHARLLDNLARIESPEAPELAVSLMEQAIALLRPLADDSMVVPVDPDLLARISMNLGSALKRLQRGPEAAERFKEAVSALESLVRTSPGNPTYRANLATALYNFANLQMASRDGTNFWQNYERSRDLLEGLVHEFPSAATYSALLATTYGNLGALHVWAGRLEDARASFDRTREICEGLVRDNPTVLKFRTDLGKTYINLSDLESRAGRHGKAADLLGPACDSLRQVFRLREGDPTAREALSTACVGLASSLADLGRYTEALAAYRECADLELELLRKKDPHFRPDYTRLQTGLLGLARCYRRLGRVSEAVEAAKQLSSRWPNRPLEPIAIARELTFCAMNTKDRAAAERNANRAIDFLRTAVTARHRDLKSLRTDPSFDPLRARPDFRDLLADAAFPANPFAR
jgi:eukaryotic-like serine/threonine-protein kinase